MATQSEISINFEKAQAVAAFIRETSDNINDNIKNGMDVTGEELKKDWTGENSIAFLKKTELIKEDLISLVSELATVADTVETIAKNLYDAEMKAIEAVNTQSQTA